MTDSSLDDACVAGVLAIQAVEDKIASGVYRLETVPCFCGAVSGHPLTKYDRYGLTSQTNLCLSCGLLYLSPRMDADSYRQFYENEYRAIYRTEDDHTIVHAENGETLWTQCTFYDFDPRVVVDIGCNEGEMLRAFLQRGKVCYGVDYDLRSVQVGQARGLPVENISVEALIERGVKADLVMMHHVLEHCLDLPAMLASVRQLLTPDGVLYIGVPGVRTTPIKLMFQNAHTYHFTYDTLEYVMETQGWTAFQLNEEIHSMWRYTGVQRKLTDYHPDAVQNNLDTLGRDPYKLPELKSENKFPVKTQRENVQAMLASPFPDISKIRDSAVGFEAIIIGGGPSVDGQLPAIRRLIDKGHQVVAIERMNDWCLKHDIVPDYLAVIDASEDVPSSLRSVSRRTTCLAATQCGQAVVDALKDRTTYIFSTPHGSLDLPTMFHNSLRPKSSVVNTGGSVTLAAMSLAMVLGMRSLHIFGFDCQITHGAYAPGITGVGAQSGAFDVEIDGKVFTTLPAYYSFAQQFFPLMSTARDMGFMTSVKVYGESIVTALSVEDIGA